MRQFFVYLILMVCIALSTNAHAFIDQVRWQPISPLENHSFELLFRSGTCHCFNCTWLNSPKLTVEATEKEINIIAPGVVANGAWCNIPVVQNRVTIPPLKKGRYDINVFIVHDSLLGGYRKTKVISEKISVEAANITMKPLQVDGLTDQSVYLASLLMLLTGVLVLRKNS